MTQEHNILISRLGRLVDGFADRLDRGADHYKNPSQKTQLRGAVIAELLEVKKDTKFSAQDRIELEDYIETVFLI